MNTAFIPTPPIMPREVLTKTELGRQEIQNRQLGLAPMVRRLLILIDGQRSVQELSAMLGGQDISGWLGDLLAHGCIASLQPNSLSAPAAPSAPAAGPAMAAPASASPRPNEAGAVSPAAMATVSPEALPGALFLQQLPPPETRSAKDTELARNVMTNTVNTIYQPYTRLTLLEAISNARTVEQVRAVFLKWEETLSQSAIGTKRLPEFRALLLMVL